MARNKAILANQRVEAAQAKVARAEVIVTQAERLVNEIQLDATTIRRTALATIGVVQSKADMLLALAYRAQRSVEIYTLEPVEQHLLQDAGHLHPDVARSYAEGEIDEPSLVSHLSSTWLQFLEPIGIQSRYTSYFDRQHDHDFLRLSFSAADRQFHDLFANRWFNFRVETSAIPPDRGDAKVTGVSVRLERA